MELHPKLRLGVKSYSSITKIDPPMKPKDRYRFVYLSMTLFGCVSILPWSFFVQATDYWMFRFRDVTGVHLSPNYKTPLQSTFTSYLVIASKVPLLFFLFVNAAVSVRLSPQVRIIPALFLNLIIFIIETVLIFIDFDNRQNLFLAVTLGTVAIVNVASAFLQGAFFGIAGSMPPEYIGAMTFGQGGGNILAAFLQILSMIGNTTPSQSATIYFSCAVAIILLAIIAFFILLETDFYKFYISAQIGRGITENNKEVPLRQLNCKLWKHIASLVLCYWFLMSICPPIQVLIVQSRYIIPDRFFIPICVFLLPCFLDLSGRLAASKFPFPTFGGRLLLALSFLRVIFVPLTMFCNVQPRPNDLPVLFHDDISFVFITLLASASNGYLQTVAVLEGPKLVEVKYKETAGSILAFAIGIGLMLGSVSSIGLIAAL